MKLAPFVLTVLFAVIAGVGAVKVMGSGEAKAAKETALERVLRTNTLRCAYTLYPTFVEKDPNTGKMSGLTYDLTEELGKALGLKVEWVAEVGSAELFQGMGTKYDANCSSYWRTPERARGGDFTRPIFYTPSYIYVRADDDRFKTLDDFNNPGVTLAMLDGEATSALLVQAFPKSKALSFPSLTPATDRFLAVVGGKADATAMEGSIGAAFMEANPGKLRQLMPFGNMANVIVIPHHEQAFKNFLDAGIAALLEQGTLRTVINRHIRHRGTVLLPAGDAGEAP